MAIEEAIVPHVHRSWLPEGALDRPALDAALGDTARQWSAKWFARAHIRPLGPIAPLAAIAGTTEWLMLDDGPAIAVLPGARHALAAMMLDAAPDAAFATDADRRVADDLSNACIDDLCRRIAQLFRLPAGAAWSGSDAGVPGLAAPRGCELGSDARAPLLRVVASTDLVIALIKAGLPPPAKGAPLLPRLTGLGTQPIALSAAIGRCRLSLADFAGLATGDVLVFDRALDAPIDLCLDGNAAPVGRCAIAQTGDRLDLDILAPLGR